MKSGFCNPTLPPGGAAERHARCRMDACGCDCHSSSSLPADWPEQIASKVEVLPSGCWEWTASCDSTGYGHVKWDGRLRPAHVVVFELGRGAPLPEGVQVDHTCHVPAQCVEAPCAHRRCVNPAHLEAVTRTENVQRSNASRDWSGLCRNGLHRWNEENILTNATTGDRQCRPCKTRSDASRRSDLPRLTTPTGVLVTEAPPESDEWFTARRCGITGTDLPKILGLSRYGNALSCWLDKRGELDDSAGEAARWGQLLEDPVAQEWATLNQTAVVRVGVIANETEDWRRASLDRLVVACPDGDGPCGLEIKTRSAFKAADWRDGMPDDVLAQVAWGRIVTGLDHMHVAALIGGQRLTAFRYDGDEVLEAYLLDAARPVWQAVLDGAPPDVHPDAEGVLLDLLDRLHAKREGSVDLDPDAVRPWLEQYAEAGDLEKTAKAMKTEAKTALVQMLGPGQVGLVDETPVFTYKAPASTFGLSADEERRLRKEMPDLWRGLADHHFITESNPRPRFTLARRKDAS